MRNETRKKFNMLQQETATMNGVDDATKKFSVDPSVEQSLEEIMQEESGFLSNINVHGVREQEGEKLGMEITSTLASTTNTLLKAREAFDPTAIDFIDRYRCEQTNFDTKIRYPKMDKWAKFDNFMELYGLHRIKQIIRDRLMIAWNGDHRSATSDRTVYPLLQDVNIGWLKHIFDKAPERIMHEGLTEENEIRIGAKREDGGDYLNIDAAVVDIVNNLIDVWHQDDTDLVCIMGREVFNSKFFNLINNYDQPTERNALDIIWSKQMVGGINAIRVPFFPPKSILITKLDNLSIYYQEETRRMHRKEQPEWDCVADFQSVNEAYVVEDYGLCAYLNGENVKTPVKKRENGISVVTGWE